MMKLRLEELEGESFDATDKNGNPVSIRIEKWNDKFRNHHGKKVDTYKDLITKFDKPVKRETVLLIDEVITTSVYDGHKPANMLMKS